MANPYLQVNGLTKSFGSLLLFEELSFGIAQGERIGIIAKNGTGKSTLLDILTGREDYDSGEIVYKNGIKVGYLEQSPHFDLDATVEQVCAVHDELRSKKVLTQLGITDLSRRMGELSGGQVKRVALAKVLIEEPDLFILDEPTNHLDLEMVEELEEELGRNCITLLMVTHDRYFLDHICTAILEIDNRHLYYYKGNYSYYLEKRQERIESTNAEIARANNLYRTELEWMRRMPQARGHKASYRQEAFYELEKVAKQRLQERSLKLNMGASYIGSKIFVASHLCKQFGDLVILNDFSYTFSRYEKMGIIGNNGTGKSTFVKMLTGLIPPDSGTLEIGETVRFGYYSQEGMAFDNEKRVIDAMRDIAEVVRMGDGKTLTVSQFLNYFLFPPERQNDYIYKLSGGERRRLYLCTVLMKSPNFLILDEPTNDLDIVTLQVLEEYLQNFKGCLIVVSHDRYFMDKVVDHLMVFNGEGEIKDFPGGYTLYREWRRENMQPEKKEKPTEEKNYKVRPQEKRKLSFKEGKELEQLEEDIALLEEEKKQLETALCSGTLGVEELTEKSKRLPQVDSLINEKTGRWMELSEIENG